MSQDGTRLVVLFVLLGLAAFFFASPVGDWVGGLFKPQETISDPIRVPAVSAKLPTLRLKREILKATPGADPDEPKLPPPKAQNRGGTLGNDEIEETIQNRQPLFQRCWTQRLKEIPSLSGTLLMQFEINPRGRVQDIQIVENNINDDVMSRCVISVLERIPFREFSGGSITLTFPLSFE